ncbi:DUF998 domain-containing protein [Nocardia goodfellowii]|uniref:Membrane protein n=1 Tax=Nocardia goodfellowii TaxID=882446 RepID=A0ABS4QB57_9NOCA|nr:DUF998 domain-containing protein [Nocardia goodfellowii]MBP2188927.1 putative membrane protein [Nocardia goodfellowii]
MAGIGRWCGIATGPLFVATFLIAGALRPEYDPSRHPVSGLALGPGGWVQTAGFIVCGVLGLVFATALWWDSEVTAILVALWAIGMIGAGCFATDPIGGYPPGAPPGDGSVHNLFAAMMVLGLTLACAAALGRRGWPWRLYTALSATLSALAFALAAAGFSGAPDLVDTAGLWQRIAIITGWTWLTTLALRSTG